MYLSWDKQTITDFSAENIDTMYNRGFVFGRPEEGFMNQTRSMRIDLSQFELSSENRRILRKTEDLSMTVSPLPYVDYSWEIGKMGKDFYETKFGDGTFSANKVKELVTSDRKDFNRLFVYTVIPTEVEGSPGIKSSGSSKNTLGFSIAVETPEMLHYSYPFYDLESSNKSMGMGMMLRAISYAKEQGKKYIYLGSAQRPSDTYKLQFKGIEWFDGERWCDDAERLKKELV